MLSFLFKKKHETIAFLQKKKAIVIISINSNKTLIFYFDYFKTIL